MTTIAAESCLVLSGVGLFLGKKVRWPGLRTIVSFSEASLGQLFSYLFALSSKVQGNSWTRKSLVLLEAFSLGVT